MKEIERKFVARSIPEELTTGNDHLITQYYLSFDPETRIRSVNDDVFYLTKKSSTPDSMIREEDEKQISSADFNRIRRELTPEQKRCVISKYRSRLMIPGCKEAVADKFIDPDMSFYLVEVEFDSVKDATDFTVPSWVEREVTNDHRYRSAEIAQARCIIDLPN